MADGRTATELCHAGRDTTCCKSRACLIARVAPVTPSQCAPCSPVRIGWCSTSGPAVHRFSSYDSSCLGVDSAQARSVDWKPPLMLLVRRGQRMGRRATGHRMLSWVNLGKTGPTQLALWVAGLVSES